MLPIFVKEQDIEPTVIQKVNQFISFKFANIQFLKLLNYLGEATSLASFLQAYKTSDRKRFFPCEWFDHPDKFRNTDFPP